MSSNSKIRHANWWIAFLKSVLLIFFVIWLLKLPTENLTKLSITSGLVTLIGGLFETGLAYSDRQANKKWNWNVVVGILDILIGIFLIANLFFILFLIALIASIWHLIGGIIAIQSALFLRKSINPNFKHNLILWIIMILSAIFFAVHSKVIGITILFWAALSSVISGVFQYNLGSKFS